MVSPNVGATGRKHIVLVDDDPQLRNMFQSAMKLKGFDVQASLSNGAELVGIIDELDPKPDVILLDERMPRMTGTEACEIIKSKYPQISIIFVSADESAEQKAIASGASMFLKKPVSITVLVRAVNSV